MSAGYSIFGVPNIFLRSRDNFYYIIYIYQYIVLDSDVAEIFWKFDDIRLSFHRLTCLKFCQDL